MRAIGALLARLAQLASPQQALHEAESIWGAIPALVVAEIGSVTPSDDLVALAADALTDVDALTDPLERAELRIGLLPLLRGAERSDLIERIAHDLKEVDDGEAVAAHLERLQRVAPDCPPSVTLRLFQQICVSTPSRELLVAVRELLPALESIGGPDLPADLAHMVTASTSSW